MIPQIFQIGPLPINSFGLMIALGLFVGIFRLQRSFQNNQIPGELAEKYVLVGGLVGLLGSRLWYMWEHYDEVRADFFGALLSSAGFTFYGGFIFSTITLIVLSRRDRIPLSKFADSVGPTLAIAYAIGRLGCQLSGDGDYGVATTSILGMSYLGGVVPTAPGVLVFPTPLYESSLCVLIAVLLVKVEKDFRWSAPFSRFGLYLLLIALERFFVEFLRINPKVVAGLSQAQVIAIVLMVIGVSCLLFGKSRDGEVRDSSSDELTSPH